MTQRPLTQRAGTQRAGIERAPTPRRAELSGLRAVCCVLVVGYHVWLGRVSGGVDVFLLISGFLLTGQLVRAGERGGIRLWRLWARTARRLVPAAATVLVGVIVLSVLLLPQVRWFQTIREITASALFVQNWLLAADSVDYFARHDEASVVQHFWSLSTQVQFILARSTALALLGLLVRRSSRVSFRRATAVALGVVFVASLAYSVELTATDQSLAYFSLFTRLWEFALGGLLALVIERVDLPGRVRVGLGWAGLVALLLCGAVLRVGSVFPGYAALLPTLAGAAVLLAGHTGARFAVDRLLASGPMRYLDEISYSLYLWHWPLLVLHLAHRESSTPTVIGGVSIIGLSVVLAALTHHLVEAPSRKVATGGWGAFLPGFSVLPVLLGLACWHSVSVHRGAAYAASSDDPDHPGALAREASFTYWGAPAPPVLPPLVTLPTDWSPTHELACGTSPRGAGLEICRAEPSVPPRARVVVVGDSHPTQFLAALRPLAAERGWELIVMSRGGCPFSSDSEIVPGDRACGDWNAAALAEIVADRPDFVFTAATRDVRVGRTEVTPPGYVERWRRLDEAGIPVLAVRDNPRFDRPPAECVRLHGTEPGRCDTPRGELFAPVAPYLRAADVPPNVQFLDLTDCYCDTETCPPVIGNIWVYMDDNHLSATYLASMTPAVGRAIDAALARNASTSG